MIGMLACAATGQWSVYVTTPITAGCRFIDWYPRRGPGLTPFTMNHPDYREGHRRHDVEANLAHAVSAVQRV